MSALQAATQQSVKLLFGYLAAGSAPFDAPHRQFQFIPAFLGSLGILVGGPTTMVAERHDDIVSMAPKAVLIGALATLLSATIAGTIVWA